MIYPLVFHPDVQPEMDDAYRWYEGQRAGLGDQFLAALDEVWTRLEKMPLIHSVVYKDIRRASPRKFPYGVFFRVRADRVEVIAVYHRKRDPKGWQARA